MPLKGSTVTTMACSDCYPVLAGSFDSIFNKKQLLQHSNQVFIVHYQHNLFLNLCKTILRHQPQASFVMNDPS